jgi:glutamate synthase domain-containing protein 1
MCGIIGVIDKRRQSIDGGDIRNSLAMMDERGNGEGAGFVAYGVYPDFPDAYALHVFFNNVHENKPPLNRLLEKWGTILHDEEIPTFTSKIKKVHTPWRYFFKPDPKMAPDQNIPAEDIIMHIVMSVNTAHNGTLIFSSGKNLGVFKASGWPEEVADFYHIQDYKGYMWLAHNRYPTNTAGWWGGAHPFNLLGWSVVHNGEITSYGTNQRFIESYGYKCTMHTDTEVVAYLVDLLVRKHGLSEKMAVRALAPPFWNEIDRMPVNDQELNRAIRLTYGPALMNGPFAICLANENILVGFTDRIKLRPLVSGEHGDRLYISSEESAIRRIEPNIKDVHMPKAGEPVIGRVIA